MLCCIILLYVAYEQATLGAGVEDVDVDGDVDEVGNVRSRTMSNVRFLSIPLRE